jgi:hypothetical protein
VSISQSAWASRGFDRQELLSWIKKEMAACQGVYVLIFLFFVYSLAVSLALGDSIFSFFWVYLLRAARSLVAVCAFLTVGLAILALRQKTHASPLRYLWERASAPSIRSMALKYSFACVVLALFMGAFLYNKTIIPQIEPFSWDPFLTQLDSTLFLGHHPWQVLDPYFGATAMIYVLDYLYLVWVPLLFVTWAGLLASPRVRRRVREQFWLATVLSWIVIGLLMATALSSAGPCFAPMLFPDLAPAYQPLNDRLADLNSHLELASSLSKAYLWEIYTGGLDEPGGISAMPSMHNAQAVLLALTAFRIDRRLGLVMAAYAALIFIGSIMLAWHYAVDGIVGVAAAVLIWLAAGFVTSRRDRTAEAKA